MTGLRLCLLLWLLAGRVTAQEADVGFYAIAKSQQYVQTGPTTVVLDEGQPFDFYAYAEPTDLLVLLEATLTLPSGAVKQLQDSQFEFNHFQKFSTLRDLDAAYPPGIHTFRFTTANDGRITVALTLPATSMVPPVRVSNYAAAQTISPAQPFTLTWDALPGGTVNDLLTLDIWEEDTGLDVFSSPGFGEAGALNGATTAVVLPANTLKIGKTYQAEFNATRIAQVDQSSYPGATGAVLFETYTYLDLRTGSTTPPAQPILVALIRQQDFRQGDATTAPALVASNAFRFQADVDPQDPGIVATASLRFPSGAQANLTAEPDAADFMLEQRFASRELMANAFPPGVYQVNIGRSSGATVALPVTLGPDTTYPRAPRILNFLQAQAINPANPFTFTWEITPAGSASDYLYFELEETATGTTVFESADFGASGALNGLSNSIALPAGTLSAGKSYRGWLTHYRLEALDSTTNPEFVTAVALASRTEFAAAAIGSISTPLSVVTASLESALLDEPYTAPLTAAGGAAPYTWSLAQGTLPPGLTLAPAGVISGAPTTPGIFTFSVAVRDAVGAAASKSLTVVVVGDDLDGFPDVIFYGIEKQQYSVQPGPGTIQPDSGSPFVFQTYVSVFDTADLRGAAVAGPDGRSTPLEAQEEFENWSANEQYGQKARLDAARPVGNYAITFDTVNDGQRRVTLPLPADSYPPTPQFLNFAATQGANPFTAITFSWQPFAAAGDSGLVNFFIADTLTGEIVFSLDDIEEEEGEEIPDDELSGVELAPGTLEAGHSYRAYLSFMRVTHTDEVSYPGVFGYVAFSSTTSLDLETGGAETGPGPGATGQIVLRSDGQTGTAGTDDLTLLNSGNALGLAFVPALDRALTSTSVVPPNSPAGTKVINIPPGGRSGFFRVTFELPLNASGIRLAGVANMDDVGRVFLNGNPLTPSLAGVVAGQVRPTANTAFNSDNPSHFRRGEQINELLIANHNPTGGGGGGAFFATVTFTQSDDIEDTAAPVIFFDPLSETVEAGDFAYFDVLAFGAEPLSYQWQFNGRDIPGATDEFLLIEDSSDAEAGTYAVVVRNAFGTVTSQFARLTVLVPPGIVTQPQGASVPVGGSVTLRVVASGQGPFSYQWQRNGHDIRGATADTLTLNNLQAADAGAYSVTVTGPSDSEDSDLAFVEVLVPDLGLANNFAARPRLAGTSGAGRGSNIGASKETGEPDHALDSGGASVWASWVAPANGIATFETLGSSVDTVLAAYTGTTLANLVSVAADDDGAGFFASRIRFNVTAGQEYQIAVDGFDGEEGNLVLSYAFRASTTPIPVIARHPVDAVVNAGGSATFEVTATIPAPATGTLTYQWFRNGFPLANGTEATLRVSNIQLSQVGVYFARVANGTESVDSQPAFLEINRPETGPANVDVRSEDKFASLGAVPPRPGGAPARLHRGRPRGGLASGYSGTQIFTTYGSTTEPGEPNHCGVIGGASQWFSYQATSSGTLSISTDGSDFDTVLAVYTGPGDSFATLQQIACDNDSGLDGRDSLVRIQAVAGTIYHIAVDGVGGSTGNVKLSYQLAAASRLTLAQQPAQGFQFTLTGQPGARYTIQTSTNLTVWTAFVTTNLPPTGSLIIADPTPAAVVPRFYRARSN